MTPPPGKGLDNPFETPLPDREMYPDDEVSQVKSPDDAWKKLEKLDRVLNRMVVPIQQIPEIAEKVSDIGERVTRVEERVATTKDRVDGLDQQSRRPHDCFQVDNIERVEVAALSLRKDVEDDTRKLGLIAADVDHIKTNVKAAKEVKRSNHYYWIGIAASFLLAGAGAVWYMRGVSAEIQMEALARDAQFKQVEVVLTKVSRQTDPAPVKEQLEQLQTAVEENGEAELEEWCSKLPESDMERLKSSLPRSSWPKCSRLGGP